MGRPVSPHRRGPQLSSRAPWRVGRAHGPDDAYRERDRAALSPIECRSFTGRHSVSRFRETLGKRVARKRVRHELRRARRAYRPYFNRSRACEFAVAKVERQKRRVMEKSRACFGRRSPAPFAFDWRTSRRGAIRFTRQPENARSNGAPLHRQSRCALGNVRRGIYNSETAGRPHFRSCPSVAGKPGEVAREIFTQSATERRKAALIASSLQSSRAKRGTSRRLLNVTLENLCDKRSHCEIPHR